MAKTAVVAGVGASLVKKFACKGCKVGMFARSSDYLHDLAAQMRETGAEVLPIAVDITDPDRISQGFQQVRAAFGPVDILVNHASGSAWKGLLALSLEEFAQAWRVSCYGAFLCSRQAIPDMLATRGGTILFTGAISSIRGRGGAPAFSSAKFAMRGLAVAYWSLVRQDKSAWTWEMDLRPQAEAFFE